MMTCVYKKKRSWKMGNRKKISLTQKKKKIMITLNMLTA